MYKKIHAHGSTFTCGRYLPDQNVDNYGWLLHLDLGIPGVNQGFHQSSNEDTFLRAAVSLLDADADLIIVEWCGAGNQRYYPDHTVTHIETNPKDTLFNQYYKLSQFLPLLDSMAFHMRKRIIHLTSDLLIDPAFLEIPLPPNNTEDISGLSAAAKAVIWPTEQTTLTEARAALNSIRTLLLTIRQSDWLNLTTNLKQQFGAGMISKDAHRWVADRVLEMIKQ